MLVTVANSITPVRTAAPEAAKEKVQPRREQEPAAPARPQPEASTKSSRPNVSLETPSHYRLVYDKEHSRTFIQIVDRSSGEEILRFPPEELVRFIENTIDRANAGSTSGLFLDRSV